MAGREKRRKEKKGWRGTKRKREQDVKRQLPFGHPQEIRTGKAYGEMGSALVAHG